MKSLLIFLALSVSQIASAQTFPNFQCEGQDENKGKIKVVHNENLLTYRFSYLHSASVPVHVSSSSWVGNLLTIQGTVEGTELSFHFLLDFKTGQAQIHLGEEKYELACQF